MAAPPQRVQSQPSVSTSKIIRRQRGGTPPPFSPPLPSGSPFGQPYAVVYTQPAAQRQPMRPNGVPEEAYSCIYDPTGETEYRTTSTGQVLRRKRVIAVPKSGNSSTASETQQGQSKNDARTGSPARVSPPRFCSEPVMGRKHVTESEGGSPSHSENVLTWFEEEPVTNYNAPLLASKGVRINNMQTLGRFFVLVVLSLAILALASFMVIYIVTSGRNETSLTVWTGLIGTVFGVWIPQPKIPKVDMNQSHSTPTMLHPAAPLPEPPDLELGVK